MVSDLVLAKELPKDIKEYVEAYVGCLAGASKKNVYLGYIEAAGFKDIKVVSEESYPVDAMFANLPDAQDAIVSIKVAALKP